MASDCIEYKQVVRTYKKQSSEIVVRNGNIEYAAVSLHIEIHFIDIFAINNIIHRLRAHFNDRTEKDPFSSFCKV